MRKYVGLVGWCQSTSLSEGFISSRLSQCDLQSGSSAHCGGGRNIPMVSDHGPDSTASRKLSGGLAGAHVRIGNNKCIRSRRLLLLVVSARVVATCAARSQISIGGFWEAPRSTAADACAYSEPSRSERTEF